MAQAEFLCLLIWVNVLALEGFANYPLLWESGLNISHRELGCHGDFGAWKRCMSDA